MEKHSECRIAYLIGIGAPIVGFFACLAGAFFSGSRKNWCGFGLSILFCLFNTVMFTTVALYRKIDSRFNRIEKLLGVDEEKQEPRRDA